MQIAQKESINQNYLEDECLAPLFKAAIGNLNLLHTLYQQEPDNSSDICQVENSLNTILMTLSEELGDHQVYLQLLKAGVVGVQDAVTAPIVLPQPELPTVSEKYNFPPIGFIAPIRGGKGMAAQIFAEIVGSINWPFSSRLKEVAHADAFKQGGEANYQREALRQIDAAIKPRFGKATFAEWTMRMAANQSKLGPTPSYTFDGFRSVDEVEQFKQIGGILIYIEADYEVRLARAIANARTVDDINPEKFKESDEIESKWIEPLKKEAKYIISNNETPEDLAANIRGVIRALQEEYSSN